MPLAVRPATEEDAHFLAARLLPEDAAEVRATNGNTPLVSLLIGVRESEESHVLLEKGVPICIWGISKTPLPTVGSIWLLCAEGLHENRVGFLRESRRWFSKFSQQYPILWNVVDERNTAHIRFLQWHGCTFINRHPVFGPERRPFLEFVRLSCVNP